MYRTPLNGGTGQAAWLPEIHVDFSRFLALRAQIQNAYLRGTARNTCTGLDSVLIANTPLPPGVSAQSRYAACDDGYIVYTLDPGISAPNLAAVQELAVGMLRVATGAGLRPITPGDTLEMWVDDIRLGGVVSTAGFAGQVGLGIVASDFANIQATFMRQDPNFRQLGDQPTYLTDNAIDIGATFRLEKLLPKSFGYSVPMTITYNNLSSDPLYISGSDLEGDAVPGLRTPRTTATSITLGVRRAVPLEGGVLAPLINNLALTTTYTTAKNRDEYTDGRAHDFQVGVDYNVTRALGASFARLLPANIVLNTTYERGNDRRFAYLKPAAAFDDTAQFAGSATRTVRTGGALTFRPLSHASVHFDISSLHDLRDYVDPLIGLADNTGRDHVAGVDIGLERQRSMGTDIAWTPVVIPWLQPQINVSSSYTMLRDPNTLALITTGPTITDLEIPRQLSNEQSTTASVTVDVPQLLKTSTTLLGPARSLLGVFQPITLTVDRYVLTTYDASAANPSWLYQLGFGSIDQFRQLGGQPATSAGVSTQITVSHSMRFPFGVTLVNRFQRVTVRNWTRQVDSTLGVGDATQLNFPDIALRWDVHVHDPTSLLSSISASARLVGSKQLLSSPGEIDLPSGNNGESRVNNYPVSFSAVWAGAHPLTTTIGATFTQSLDNRPGISGRGHTVAFNADVARAFSFPADWHARSDLRTRLSFQNTHGQSDVLNPLAITNRSRLTDNGRRAVTLTADTDIAENLGSSFVISRVSSFDRNLNRQFTQTVLSAVLHLQFFAGDFK
jgi:hypothetical protein